MRAWVWVTGLAVVLAGCATAGDPGVESTTSASGPAAAAPVVTEPACPEVLPQPDPPEHGLGPSELATDVPTLGPADGAWVCKYGATDTGEADPSGGALYGWVVSGAPAVVPEDGLAQVDAALSALEVADAMRACNADLGPRYLLVFTSGESLTGVAIDDYGCRDVRLTDDPWTVPPGESAAPGLVPGVLDGGQELLTLMRDMTDTAERASASGPECPDALPSPLGGTPEGERRPAESAPSLPAFDTAWTCVYFGDEGPVAAGTVEGEALEALPAMLAGLEPTAAERGCTFDYGPTVLLVLEGDFGRTGVAIETYGCHDAYLTGDPWAETPEPSDGLVAGMLSPPQELADAARAWAGRA